MAPTNMITAEEQEQGFLCKEGCGATAQLVGQPFTLGGTAIETMQRATCLGGHTYHVVLSLTDLPTDPDGSDLPSCF